MLFLTGTELIFSIVAGMGLFCEFVVETVGHTEIFSLLLIVACSLLRPFQLLTLPASEEAGVHKELGSDTAGTAHPN